MMEHVTLRTLLDDHPRTKSLKNGMIPSDLIRFEVSNLARAHKGFKAMVREGKFDWGELAIVTFLQAKDHGKPLVLLPAVIGGQFMHHCLVYNANRNRLTPEALRGKIIGVRSYSQTTGTWLRGILQNEYSVAAEDINWVSFVDSHVAEYSDPPNVTRAEKGKDLAEMLLSGEVDAAVIGTSDMPDDPCIQPVIVNPKKTAAEWYEHRKIVPINHMAVVRQEISKNRPEVVQELYRMLKTGRDLDTKPIDGIQMRPFGVEPLRGALEMIIHYAFQQKIISRKMMVDELFDETTLALG